MQRDTFSELSSGDEECDSDGIDEAFQSIYAASRVNDDNWSLKRRTDDGESIITSSMTPIAMLVPAPADDVCAQIGDRNADETSDLSEADGSDFDDSLEAEESKSADPSRSPRALECTKASRGERAESQRNDLVDLLQPGSLVSEQSLNSQSPAISEAKNELLLIDSPATSASQAAASIRETRETKSVPNNAANLMEFDSVPAAAVAR